MPHSSACHSRPLVLVLLGPPGTGKGTQAKMLETRLNIPHISTGDLFREHIHKKTPLGMEVKSYMDAGLLVPDEFVLNMLIERAEQTDCSRGYILDGFPRTIPQAEALDVFFLKKHISPLILNLVLSDHCIIERLSHRQICSSCGASYHKIFSPSMRAEQCDRCGGTLIQRIDDTEQVIKKRLQVYHDQTKPLIAFYAKRPSLYSVDCDTDPQTIFARILRLIDQ